MYSRQMLVKTVQEYKVHSSSITRQMAKQTMELEECRALVVAEIQKREELDARLRSVYIHTYIHPCQ